VNREHVILDFGLDRLGRVTSHIAYNSILLRHFGHHPLRHKLGLGKPIEIFFAFEEENIDVINKKYFKDNNLVKVYLKSCDRAHRRDRTSQELTGPCYSGQSCATSPCRTSNVEM